MGGAYGQEHYPKDAAARGLRYSLGGGASTIRAWHCARHTFATTTTLAKGVPIETVSKMLGHTNIETTQIYARITNNKISSDMQGLDKKFVGIEKIYKEVAM